MKALYTQTDIISKLQKAFYEIFSAESTPTKEHLFDLLLSVLCLNGFSSVNYNFEHFIQYISDNKLKSYYFTLNESKIDLSEWIRNMVRIVITNLFGKKPVHAIVTKTKNGTQRLFICTKSPDELNFDFTSSELGKASLFFFFFLQFLPLTVYSMRWSIEVTYYEQKKFWSLGNYMLRSKIGIERLTNLLTLLYSFMTLLPFYDKTFSALSNNSPQQSRFVIGMTIWQELFFAAFEHGHISSKNALSFTCSHH